MMDYGEVARSIRSVWTLRFATIAQSSSLSLAMDSIVWKRSSSLSGFTNWRIVTDDHLFEMAWLYEISGLSDLETTWSLLLLRGACLGRHAIGWLLPNCELSQTPVHSIRIAELSFSDDHSLELSNLLSLQSYQMREWYFYETPLFSFDG